ncbi:hypothetical protein MKW92_030950 [Papaver armeniacum]|nr:hypothetical protein MKW92_030950 [Papaver armeniacum]
MVAKRRVMFDTSKECVKLFLSDPKTNYGFFFPRCIQNQCATIVLNFCGLFRHATDDHKQQLYDSCRKTLVSILKSTAFSNRTRYFGIANTSYLIVGLYQFVTEIVDTKLLVHLKFIYEPPSSLPTCDLTSLCRDFQEFALFSLHLRRAIEDYLVENGLSLPVNTDDLKEDDNPCYLVEIFLFHCVFSSLLRRLEQGLHCLEEAIRDAGGVAQHIQALRGWRRMSFGGFLRVPSCNKLSYQVLKEGAIDFESRRHLMVMMFPEVKDDNGKLHKLLVDRSLLFKESFELIAHVKPKSLHNGLFVEFKDEVATGHECPEDRRRFFPNPAQLKPEQLDLRERNIFGRHTMRRSNYVQELQKILEMDADFVDSDAMGLTFVREIEEFGSRKTVELCPGGNNIVVNSKNREQYVHLLIQHCFVKSISAKVAYFARGFADMLCKPRLAKRFFQATGLKGLDFALLGGDNPIVLKEWKAHTMYEGYRETDEQICWFWKVVECMSMEQQRQLLFFWTSVKYLPVNGFSGLPYLLTIYKTSGSDERLPSSHTCYFFRLSLPHYPSLAIMQQRLSFICERHVACNFGYL